MKNHKKHSKMQTIPLLAGAMLLLLPGRAGRAGEDGWTTLGADDNFGAWRQPTGDWYVAGAAMLDPNNDKRLAGKPGAGVMINGKTGRTPSLVTKHAFGDVELHVEFMVARGSNSGVIFHGNYEIQILDSHHVKNPTGGHCGGIYPRAVAKPKYHHIDKGSPPKVNAAKPPGEWQTFDIIFQSPRFDENGKKTAHAKFVKVVHNGKLIQENHEVPYASGTNWDRKQHPRGPIIFQGDYGPVALRNVRVRLWKAGAEKRLNVPPEGFTALFNGKDLTGWHTPPVVREYWSIEDGVLKSPGLIEQWGASLATKKHYRDFILMLDFRMPTISDSGINFRRLIPEIPGFGDMEQFNLRSKGGMGHLESYYFLPKQVAEKMGLREEEKPHVRHIDPKVGVWHTVKLTMKGRTFSAEYDGEVLYDNFEYHDWMMNMEPAPIRLQKHIVVDGDNLGKMNPCPIEYRNIFIKEIKAGTVDVPAEPRVRAAPDRKVTPVPVPNSVSRWKWSRRSNDDASRKAIPYATPQGQTIYTASFGVSDGDQPPVVLLPKSRLRVRGHIASAHAVYFGLTVRTAGGEFAGRFQTTCPATEFQAGQDFVVTLQLRGFRLDPSLNEMNDRLPSSPVQFAVESIWFHTLNEQAGLEIAEVELIPPAEDESE